MISNELMKKYQVVNVWKCLKKEERILAGYVRGYLCGCTDGKWLAVITDTSWEESEVLLFNGRVTATKILRERGFFTRMSKVYPKRI